MQFSLYSLGLIAALTGLVQALPTGTTPSLGDLTTSGSAGTTNVPELPALPSSTADSQSSSGSSDINGGNFMGLALGNTLDLGNLQELPKASTNVILGSLQQLSSTQSAQSESSNDDAAN